MRDSCPDHELWIEESSQAGPVHRLARKPVRGMNRWGKPAPYLAVLFLLVIALPPLLAFSEDGQKTVTERDVAVPMRDGVVLRADIYRPANAGPFPALVYRTPYGKKPTAEWYDTHLAAVERGYAVVIQDVRGRYASEGEFYPYINEGRDGYDTIEWVAGQPWCTGEVGTYGLSYPGAVQWLAAVEGPPHLKAMVPAMTFSTPRRFFYFNGVFDLSWLPWIHNAIAPDTRLRKKLPGPKTRDEAATAWRRHGDRMRGFLPLLELPDLKDVAPYYYDWLRHPPTDAWWDWAELRDKYDRVGAAVLNLSGWYDEAYGPEGATTNFNGLVAVRAGESQPRTQLIMGPWIHGVDAVAQTRTGELDFGAEAAIDYNEVVLRWMDRHVRGIDNGVDDEGPVRLFVMGANRWRDESSWPPLSTTKTSLYLIGRQSADSAGVLRTTKPSGESASTSFVSNPSSPVADSYEVYGPHDYRDLAARSDLAVFETEPLTRDLEVTGAMTAEIYLSCDCRDLDLWVKVLDVAPDGAAYNLMSPGLDLLRASYRRPERGRQLLAPGEIYELRLPFLITSNLFRRGHRIRVQISGAFSPHLSRNLQTGELEITSARMRAAEITLHHDRSHPSRLVLPVIPSQENNPPERGSPIAGQRRIR